MRMMEIADDISMLNAAIATLKKIEEFGHSYGHGILVIIIPFD